MALQITYHINAQNDLSRWQDEPIMPAQIGNRVDLAVSATAAPATAVAASCFARLRAKGEDCVIAWGATAVAVAANHVEMSDGTVEWIFLKAGERISVIAAA